MYVHSVTCVMGARISHISPPQTLHCHQHHQHPPNNNPQTPAADDRAAPYKPKAALLFTGSNATSAAALSAGLLPEPSLNAGNLLSAQRYLERFTAEMGPGAAAVPGACGCVVWLCVVVWGGELRGGAGMFVCSLWGGGGGLACNTIQMKTAQVAFRGYTTN